ncbi:hypothetical protein K1T71_000355 [Dendrolimus kikuchii]|uniref:Uncharacterized protein n=1 Tax=Dendrolimus kikuchii TaxID=765133 RepID=A0ACC1DJ49_9NEOP|nr:hypothetical protein K1T71_000355 [Dendrolimus kikuchii]
MPQSDFWPFAKKKPQDEADVNVQEASMLQKQLGDMEGEVKEIQMELAAIRRDRMGLSYQRQRLFPVNEVEEILRESTVMSQTNPKLNSDKSEKFPEIAKLREDLIRAKNAADEERFQREKYESKLKDLENKLNSICSTGVMAEEKGGPRRFSEEEVGALKTQIRDMKDEMDEMKITVTEKTEQLQEYRIKYLQAQQQVEELKRQVDMIEFDNKQVSDQIQIEIQKMKTLERCYGRPEIIISRALEDIKKLPRSGSSASELNSLATKLQNILVLAVNNLNQEKYEKSKIIEENKIIKACLDEKEKEINELNKHFDDLKCQVLRLGEKLSQEETRYKEKATECSQLIQDLDELRDESNRSLGRYKERSDSMRRYLQTQISELERQLIQSRAQCRAFQKERDEIRQRMQMQINNLQENFELVEIRLRALQNQVTSLKNSYTDILTDDEDNVEFNTLATI